ncbi:MAG: glycosyltransferase family 2 protein [Planctomycetota bacterium]
MRTWERRLVRSYRREPRAASATQARSTGRRRDVSPPPRTRGSRRPLLSVIAPCLDEAEGIEAFYRALKTTLDGLPGVDHEILIVDDGSTDATLEKINALARDDPRLVPLSLSRNFGQAAALSAGLDAARGDAVVLMDSDLQHPPALLPRMVELWREGNDIVSAVRRRSTDASWWKSASSAAFYWILNRISATPIEPGAADFCLLSRRVRDAIVGMPERHRFLRGLISWVGFPRALVPFDAPARAAGSTKYGLRRMLGMALDAIFSFSVAPIRLVVRVGLVVVLLGLAYLAHILLIALLRRDLAPGWASLICVALILGGLQIAFIGVIGEYLARVFEQTKGRPLYVLKQGREERARTGGESAVGDR